MLYTYACGIIFGTPRRTYIHIYITTPHFFSQKKREREKKSLLSTFEDTAPHTHTAIKSDDKNNNIDREGLTTPLFALSVCMVGRKCRARARIGPKRPKIHAMRSISMISARPYPTTKRDTRMGTTTTTTTVTECPSVKYYFANVSLFVRVIRTFTYTLAQATTFSLTELRQITRLE